MSSPDAGTGRRTEFKPRRSSEHAGSTPAPGTFNPFSKRILKVYGPYVRKDGRRQVVVRFSDKTTTTMLLSRWHMTQSLQRVLDCKEHVDHIDGNPLNDCLANLQILSQKENNRKTSLGKPFPLAGIEKGWRHGTVYAWMKKKCACDNCAAAQRKWQEARNIRRRKKTREEALA